MQEAREAVGLLDELAHLLVLPEQQVAELFDRVARQELARLARQELAALAQDARALAELVGREIAVLKFNRTQIFLFYFELRFQSCFSFK